MAEDPRIDRIEAWLQGKLPAAEAAAFRSEMAADPALAEEVELHRLALQAGQHLSEQHLWANVQQWINTGEAKSPAFSAHRYWPWALAALLLAAFILSYFQHAQKTRRMEERQRLEIAQRDSIIASLQTEIRARHDSISQSGIKNPDQKTIHHDIKAPHRPQSADKSRYQPIALAFAPSPNARGEGRRSPDEQNPNILSVYQAFDAGRYDEAVRRLKQIPPGDTNGLRMAVYELPYALFYDRQYGEATAAFLALQKIEKFEAGQVEWFLLLCYLADDRPAHAQKALADILNKPGHPFYDKAQKLKIELEKNQ